VSTLTKIDKVARTAKHDRRDAIRSLHGIIPRITGTFQITRRLSARITVMALEDIRRASFLTGRQKQAMFDRIIDRLKEAA
jgi:hypothetical protein